MIAITAPKFISGENAMTTETLERPLAGTASAAPMLRIAVASRDGTTVNLHFGQTQEFLVYDVTAEGASLIARRDIESNALSAGEDPRETVCRILADCKVLLVAKIGPMPAEKLGNAGIDAIDAHAGKPVETALMAVFAGKTAPVSDEPIDASSFRLAHAMLRVSDMERSIDFYTRLLGMKVLEQRDHKKNQFTQAYLGYGDGSSQMTLELVFNWMQEEPYVKGDAFGHIAIQVTNINRLCNRLAAEGVPLPRAPRGQRHGNNIIAFIEDPDGHRIELIQPEEPAS
jgi:lactoylglutathione lyase